MCSILNHLSLSLFVYLPTLSLFASFLHCLISFSTPFILSSYYSSSSLSLSSSFSSLSFCLFLPLSASLCLSLSVSLCLSLSLPVSLSSLSLSVSLSFSPFFSLYVRICAFYVFFCLLFTFLHLLSVPVLWYEAYPPTCRADISFPTDSQTNKQTSRQTTTAR
jgi:hypothetical protein